MFKNVGSLLNRIKFLKVNYICSQSKYETNVSIV